MKKTAMPAVPVREEPAQRSREAVLPRGRYRSPAHVTLFRRAMVTRMLENGADVSFIQAILDQAQLATTEIYTHVSFVRANHAPGLYFERGRYLLKLGRHRQAVDDLDRALNFCEQQQNDYYRESLFFMRADALIKLDEKAAALVDLSNVRDDFALWTTELRTKQALLAECAK